MITRREFLFNTAAGLFIAASPKIIVDMGANLWRKRPMELEVLRSQSLNSDAYIWYLIDRVNPTKVGASIAITGREFMQYPEAFNRIMECRVREAVDTLLKNENAYLIGDMPKIELSTTPRPLIEGQNANKSITFNGL